MGEIYEEETNRSFLESIKDEKICPGAGTIEELVGKALADMRLRFEQTK